MKCDESLEKIQLERQVDADALAFTDLMLASFVSSNGKKFTLNGKMLVRKSDVSNEIRSSSSFPADSFCSFRVAMRVFERAQANRLVSHVLHKKTHGFECVELTDAGKHLVMTHATGVTARGILAEIEAEETAGQA